MCQSQQSNQRLPTRSRHNAPSSCKCAIRASVFLLQCKARSFNLFHKVIFFFELVASFLPSHSSFFSADSSVNRKFGGSGLGLSISKHLAQLMNGDLTFVSNPDSGPGTTFTLRFPTTVRFMLTMPLKIAPRVVVVEQCATLRRVLTKRLKALACNVQAFDSLAAARPSLQQCAPPPAAASSASEAESADEVLGSTTTGKRKSVDSNFSSQLQPASSETILLVDSCTEGQSLSNIQSVMPWLRVIFMGYNTAKQVRFAGPYHLIYIFTGVTPLPKQTYSTRFPPCGATRCIRPSGGQSAAW